VGIHTKAPSNIFTIVENGGEAIAGALEVNMRDAGGQNSSVLVSRVNPGSTERR